MLVVGARAALAGFLPKVGRERANGPRASEGVNGRCRPVLQWRMGAKTRWIVAFLRLEH